MQKVTHSQSHCINDYVPLNRSAWMQVFARDFISHALPLFVCSNEQGGKSGDKAIAGSLHLSKVYARKRNYMYNLH